MQIRRLTIDNYEEMTRLWSKADLPFKPKGRDSKDAIAGEMQANPEFFLGAIEDHALIGVAILSCDERKGWINRLAVDPDYRRRGVAKKLIEESERIFRQRKMRIFCALIEDYNEASKKLFRGCGYTEHHDIIYFSKRDSEEV